MKSQRHQVAELSFVLALAVSAANAWGAEKKSETDPSPAPANEEDSNAVGGEQVNVDAIKQKYWARGDETEMGVVQNRTYSKSHKFEFGILGAMISSDPLLSVQGLGAHLGYHFNEYFSLQLLGWKAWTGTTASFDALNSSIKSQAGINIVPDSNYQRGFLGSEASFSILYGKLSLIGQAIIYYDLHFLGGAGVQFTETGNDLAPFLGLGQSVYLSKSLSLRLDYRLITYSENLLYKANPAVAGQVNPNSRINFSNTVSLGLDILFGPGSKK